MWGSKNQAGQTLTIVVTLHPHHHKRVHSWKKREYLYLVHGLDRGFQGVLREMRWGYERSCRTAQCDNKSRATPLVSVTWNKRKSGDENINLYSHSFFIFFALKDLPKQTDLCKELCFLNLNSEAPLIVIISWEK